MRTVQIQAFGDRFEFTASDAEAERFMIAASAVFGAYRRLDEIEQEIPKLRAFLTENMMRGVTSMPVNAEAAADSMMSLIHASLDALADLHGYDSPHWTADELAIDVAMSAPALDGRDPQDLKPAVEQWLRQRRQGC